MWKNAKAAKIETTVIDLQSKDDRTKEKIVPKEKEREEKNPHSLKIAIIQTKIKAITIISTIIAKIGEDKKVDR